MTLRTLTSCSLSTREIAARTEAASASARPDFGRTTRNMSSEDPAPSARRSERSPWSRRDAPSPVGPRRRSRAHMGVACGDADRPQRHAQADRRSAVEAPREGLVHDADGNTVACDRADRRRGRPGSADRVSRGTPGKAESTWYSVATAVLLLFGAGLLLRTLMAVDGFDRGYRAESVLSMLVDPLGSKYPTDDRCSSSSIRSKPKSRRFPASRASPGRARCRSISSMRADFSFEIVGDPPVDESQRPRTEYRWSARPISRRWICRSWPDARSNGATGATASPSAS